MSGGTGGADWGAVPYLSDPENKISRSSLMTAVGVRRDKAALSSGCESPPGQIAPAGSNRSSHGGNEMAEAFGVAGHDR